MTTQDKTYLSTLICAAETRGQQYHGITQGEPIDDLVAELYEAAAGYEGGDLEAFNMSNMIENAVAAFIRSLPSGPTEVVRGGVDDMAVFAMALAENVAPDGDLQTWLDCQRPTTGYRRACWELAGAFGGAVRYTQGWFEEDTIDLSASRPLSLFAEYWLDWLSQRDESIDDIKHDQALWQRAARIAAARILLDIDSGDAPS